jgi:molecular chaperone HscB
MQRDHFKLFGLPPHFSLDETQLRETWHRLQQASHPDQHVGGSATSRIDSMEESLAINDAYKTLSDPVARAWYLIERAGGEIETLQRVPLSEHFFQELIAWREQIAELEPTADLFALVDQIRQTLNGRKKSLLEALKSHLDMSQPPQIEAAAEEALQLQFIEKTRTELKEAELRLLDER